MMIYNLLAAVHIGALIYPAISMLGCESEIQIGRKYYQFIQLHSVFYYIYDNIVVSLARAPRPAIFFFVCVFASLASRATMRTVLTTATVNFVSRRRLLPALRWHICFCCLGLSSSYVQYPCFTNFHQRLPVSFASTLTKRPMAKSGETPTTPKKRKRAAATKKQAKSSDEGSPKKKASPKKKKAPAHQVLTERDEIPKLWTPEQAAKDGSYSK